MLMQNKTNEIDFSQKDIQKSLAQCGVKGNWADQSIDYGDQHIPACGSFDHAYKSPRKSHINPERSSCY